MSIFKFLKRKKEEEIIDIEKYEDIDEEKKVKKIEEIKTEEKIEEEEGPKELNFSDTKTKFEEAKKMFPSIYHEYYLCKIFSRVALLESDYNMQVIELDKQIEKLKNDLYDVERSLSFYSKVSSEIENEEARIDARVEKLYIQEKMLSQRFKDINNLYYKELKISTVSVCINKTNDELKEFFDLIDSIVRKYKDMTEAAYDLYYSSGDFIVSFINELVFDFKYTGNDDYINKYTYSFFLATDVVITLDINEWIVLYNKVKFAYKSLSNIEVDAYLRLQEKYNYFEAIYTILMMQVEISGNKEKKI